MNDFIIMTDSAGDLSQEKSQELGIVTLPLTVRIQEAEYAHHPDFRELPSDRFYKMMRNGEIAQTSAVNAQTFMEGMEPILQEGKDILCITLSSKLSVTIQGATMAAAELLEKYPDRKIYVVDSLTGSLGEGLLCYLCAEERKKGATIDEVWNYAEKTKGLAACWLTVDDLNHLRRGGRISSTSAVLGSMLGVKPILHVNKEGSIAAAGKVRGRQTSLKTLVDHMERTAIDPKSQTVFISHGDCLPDAQKLAVLIKERFGTEKIFIYLMGPIIGAHVGPGAIALFFLANSRE